jgi:coenzyme F420 hydrogenase subunit beta
MTNPVIADPSADIREEIAQRSGTGELINKIWFHKTAAAVIDADRCIRCGVCIAACPSQSLTSAEDGLPTLVKMCTGCSRCWDFCPLAGTRTERLWKLTEGDDFELDGIGKVEAAYSARALERPDGAQDGGVVTTMLQRLLDAGAVDGVLATRRLGAFESEPYIAHTSQELAASAGSVYHQSLPLALVDPGVLKNDSNIAVVGTPCQISGLRALQSYGVTHRDNAADNVSLTIALFCTRSFDGRKLAAQLLDRGVDIASVATVAVQAATLQCVATDGALIFEAPVKEFRDSSLRGCDECADFTGRVADISVGSLGTPDGFTTVVIRTEAGAAAWKQTLDAFEATDDYDLDEVANMDRRTRRGAIRNMNRDFDPDAPLWINYEDHLHDYTGTDREPRTPPGFRSHHYTVSC